MAELGISLLVKVLPLLIAEKMLREAMDRIRQEQISLEKKEWFWSLRIVSMGEADG